MAIVDLPPELLPRILADPGCARAVAWTCRQLYGAVRRDIFTRDGEIVRSEYYTCKWCFCDMSDFVFYWLSQYRIGADFEIVIANCVMGGMKVVMCRRDSWKSTWVPKGWKKFTHTKIFTGKGASKGSKRSLIDRAIDERKCGQHDAMLIGRQPICDGKYIFLGTKNTIYELAQLVAQSCVVYLAV